MSCPNCQSNIVGDYCPACGQRQSGRLRVQDVLKSLPGSLIERGLWPTFYGLTTGASQVPVDYIEGRRRRYINPVSYYVVGASAQLFMLWLNKDYLYSGFSDASFSGALVERIEDAGIDDPKAWMAARYMWLIQNSYTWLGLFTFVLPFALGIRFFTKSSYNFAESLVFSLYTVAHLFLITALVQPITLRTLGGGFHGIVSQVFYFSFTAMVAYTAFRPGWRAIVGTMAAFILGVLTFFLGLSIGTMLVFIPGLIGTIPGG